MFERELDQGVAAMQVAFGCDVVAVMFDGAEADAESRGRFRGSSALGDQLEDLVFGRREDVHAPDRCGGVPLCFSRGRWGDLHEIAGAPVVAEALNHLAHGDH